MSTFAWGHNTLIHFPLKLITKAQTASAALGLFQILSLECCRQSASTSLCCIDPSLQYHDCGGSRQGPLILGANGRWAAEWQSISKNTLWSTVGLGIQPSLPSAFPLGLASTCCMHLPAAFL